MTTTAPTAWPTARPGRAGIEAGFGPDRATLAHRALTTGDPLADALVTEMRETGAAHARRLFHRAATDGITAVPDAGPALRAFFDDVETLPSYVDDRLLDHGSAAFFTTNAGIHTISLSAGSLLRVYDSPSIAYVLATTGRLVDGADRRITETAKWLLHSMLPGSLRRGGAGYIATLQVRMLHAHMRALARDRGFDEAAHGVPINQIDLARTWMDFTLTSFTAEEKIGFDLKQTELADLYRYWWYLGHLLGIDPRLIEGIVDHTSARHIDDLLQAVTAPSVDESATLTDATIRSIAGMLKTTLNLPTPIGVPLLRAIARKVQGPSVADELAIPRARLAEAALPLLTTVFRADRARARRSPEKWERLRIQNMKSGRAMVKTTKGATTYEAH